MSEHNPRAHLDAQFGKGVELSLSEAADLCLREGDVLLEVIAQRGSSPFKGLVVDDERCRVPGIELVRDTPDPREAVAVAVLAKTAADVGEWTQQGASVIIYTSPSVIAPFLSGLIETSHAADASGVARLVEEAPSA